MITCEVGNINTKLTFDDYSKEQIAGIKQYLHEYINPLDPNRYRIKTYRLRDKYGNRLWDGRVKIADIDSGVIPTGLFKPLESALINLTEKGYKYKIIDNQTPMFDIKVPSEISYNGNGLEKDITLRDYQYESVVKSFEEQLGILLLSTNAGKSMCAISIFDLLENQVRKNDEKLLFIAPNTSVMLQLYDKYKHYLGEDIVGIWGDGKKDLDKDIVVATYQTINSALKKPKVKITKKAERWKQRLATTYYEKVLSSGNAYNNLYALANNLIPKYKYEQDDPEELKSIYLTLSSHEETVDYFNGARKAYDKMVRKKAKKEFEKYDEAVGFLDKVIATIVDECQGAGASSYWNIFQRLNNSRMRIGLTGTMPKQDKIKMLRIKAILGEPINYVTNKEMIERGVSAKPHIKMVPISLPDSLEEQVGYKLQQRAHAGLPASELINYQLSYELGVINNRYFNKTAAELAYKASEKVKMNGKAVMIMVNSIEHGENIAQELDGLGATYDYVKGEDDSKTREDVILRVKNGKLPIVIATKIFEAGIDIPNIQVFVQCSGGKSYVSLLQRVGRILRIQEDKKDVYVFDLINTNSDILYRQGRERYKQYKDEGFDIN